MRKILALGSRKTQPDDMLRLSFLLLIQIGISSQAWSRVVNSQDDLVRLRGFSEEMKLRRELDRERMSDVKDLAREREAWEKQRLTALGQHLRDKQKQKQTVKDDSVDYKVDLKGRRRRRNL